MWWIFMHGYFFSTKKVGTKQTSYFYAALFYLAACHVMPSFDCQGNDFALTTSQANGDADRYTLCSFEASKETKKNNHSPCTLYFFIFITLIH